MRKLSSVGRRIGIACSAALVAAASIFAPARAGTIGLHAIVPAAVTTLLFHQVSDAPIRSAHGEDNVKHPWLSPARFDALLSAFERRGYTVVSLEDALDALGTVARAPSGTTLPAKPLLLTFDDGYASALTEATPILRAHHATATMFFEGKLTGTRPGRLTLADLRAMRASGIWRLESHGWMGHGVLPISRDGTTSPYWYGNLMWRAVEGRFESDAEYAARVRADIHRFRTTFEPLLGMPLDVFAYPSGEFGQNGPLAPGGNALTRLEAGHSNARDLEPILLRALASEGIRAAFVVSLPGSDHAAAPQDGPYTFPRIGVGAEFDPASLDALATGGIELPEIANDDTFADCTALASDGADVVAASATRPELFRLRDDGRRRDEIGIPALSADRMEEPALISALVRRDDEVTLLQQAGWWPGATPYMTQLHLAGDRAIVDRRTALPTNLDWSVGAIRRGDRILAMTDEGRFYDVSSAAGAPLFSVALPSGNRHARFAGPAVVGGRTFVYDRIAALLEEIDDRGDVIASLALAGDIRALAAQGDDLLALDCSAKRRIVRRFRLARG